VNDASTDPEYRRPAHDEVHLRLDVKVEALTTTSNQRVLETILTNLLTNAIRYTPPGGSIILQARRQRGQPVLSVKDTGIGIPPKHRNRIFDRLYRIDTDRGRTSGGSGLGLAIVRRGAHALGARIELTSEPGKGSTFTLVLPRQDPARSIHATPRLDEESSSVSGKQQSDSPGPGLAQVHRRD
jgi:two-component system phosphate regulon sensor histidine kinase PhoR